MTTLAASASSSAEPGTLAFIIVFGMAVVLVFLFRSMSRHLRKVNTAARDEIAAKELTRLENRRRGLPEHAEPARAGDLPKDS